MTGATTTTAAPDARAQSSPWRAWVVELFAASNLGFLAFDVFLAHLANRFEHWSEWVPVLFSALAPLLLLPGLIRRRLGSRWARTAGLITGTGAIVVGVSGLVLHLQGSFFVLHTLKSLVYTAPFIAPLSYVGVGLLLVLNRLEASNSEAYSLWVTFLALGGFIGNFGLSLADHAVNGFFHWAEWIPVVAAAFGSSLLLFVCLKPHDRPLLVVAALFMALEIVVGGLGFVLHGLSIPSSAWLRPEVLTYRAPPFAPLLFADLGVLALVGLHGLAAAQGSSALSWQAVLRRSRTAGG
jgi:hypothetical protein